MGGGRVSWDTLTAISPLLMVLQDSMHCNRLAIQMIHGTADLHACLSTFLHVNLPSCIEVVQIKCCELRLQHVHSQC